MKYLFVLILSFPVCANSFLPENGTYQCLEGNNDSVCDQRVKVITENGKLTALSVVYAGYCNGQGPYRYPCIGETCTDGVISISFTSETQYSWNNIPRKIHCKMGKLN